MVGIPSEEDARVRPYRSMEVPLEFPMGFRLVGRSSEGPFEQLLGIFEEFFSACKTLNVYLLGAYFRPFLRC